MSADIVSLLDLKTLQLEKESFIEENLKEQFSDIIYQIQLAGKDAYVYALLEHKSSPDRFTTLQLLQRL